MAIIPHGTTLTIDGDELPELLTASWSFSRNIIDTTNNDSEGEAEHESSILDNGEISFEANNTATGWATIAAARTQSKVPAVLTIPNLGTFTFAGVTLTDGDIDGPHDDKSTITGTLKIGKGVTFVEAGGGGGGGV